jgi:hypothetical protein
LLLGVALLQEAFHEAAAGIGAAPELAQRFLGVEELVQIAEEPFDELNSVSVLLNQCGVSCAVDLTGDGNLNFFDVGAFLSAFNAMDLIADFNGDGSFNFFDVTDYLQAFNAGCP